MWTLYNEEKYRGQQSTCTCMSLSCSLKTDYESCDVISTHSYYRFRQEQKVSHRERRQPEEHNASRHGLSLSQAQSENHGHQGQHNLPATIQHSWHDLIVGNKHFTTAIKYDDALIYSRLLVKATLKHVQFWWENDEWTILLSLQLKTVSELKNKYQRNALLATVAEPVHA